jgi:hypothetical protein
MDAKALTISRMLMLGAVFVLAFAVRSLYAVDQAGAMYTPEQTGTRMAQRYDESAVSMLAGEGILWPRVRDRERTGLLARPPGYALYLAGVYATLGRSFFAAQLVQNLLTSLACVLLVLATARLASWPIGVAAGLVAALSPQLGFVSALVLPDALSALPLMAALLVLAYAHPGTAAGWWTSALVGALVGVGVWLRPNVVLLAPCLSLVLIAVSSKQRRRGLVHAVALSAAAAATVLPITIRNYVVFGEFVPVSINGGLTLWQGVADAGGRELGARRHDTLVAEEEATRYGNPRYLDWWAEPDGIWRDQERYRRAGEVIRANPGRYLRLMLGRMGEMLNYAAGEAPTVLALEPARVSGPESRFLAPGRAVARLRPLLDPLQRLVCWVLSPLVVVGALVLAWNDWRRTLLLVAISLYYLVTESAFIYEWRVVAPMHYGLIALAAGALVAMWQGASRLRRRSRSAAPHDRTAP